MPKRARSSLRSRKRLAKPGGARAPRARAPAPSAIEHIAREIKRIARRDVGDAEFCRSRAASASTASRERRQARIGVALADLARQLDQRRVDLVLHQRGAGRGRALGRAAPVHHHDLQPAVAQARRPIIAPVMPAPITSTSVSRSRCERPVRHRRGAAAAPRPSARCANPSDFVTTAMPFQIGQSNRPD